MTATGQPPAAVAAEAARVLQAGGLVALPTETVYGLAADAGQQAAVARIYTVKGRPAGHPLIVHVVDAAQGRWWAEWSDAAQRLADRFWPGPLTLVLPRRAGVPAWACGQEPTIGLRCPSHPVARAVLTAFAALGGHGVAAPSANRFGRISPTCAQHVIDDLGPDAALIVDGGASEVGLESTIVDLSRGEPVLLRPGAVSAAQLADALGRPVSVSAALTDPARSDPRAPRVPGALPSHYAPHTPTRLVTAEALPAELARLVADGRRVALLLRASTPLPSPLAPRPHDHGVVVRRPSDDGAETLARELYSLLRELDAAGCDLLLVQAPPPGDAWQAIRDRLTRAAHR